MTRIATKKEQLDVIAEAVETAILQAAQISGLRNWFVRDWFIGLKEGEWPNEEAIVQRVGECLRLAFSDIIDPDDKGFLESNWYLECDTEKGVFRLADIAYESEIEKYGTAST